MTTDWNVKQGSYAAHFGILLGLTGLGIILSGLLAQVIWGIMVGGEIPLDYKVMLQPKYYNANMVLQGASTFLIFFLPAMTLAAVCYKEPNLFLGFNRRFSSNQVFLAILILVATIPFAGAVSELNRILPIPVEWEKKFKGWETARQAQESALIKINSLYKYLVSLFIIGLLPALFEEVYFRSGLQNILTRWIRNPWIAIIITSIIFSIIHVSYYGFLVRFSLGIVLGLLFYYSKNIWLPIIFHFLFNGLQVTFLYIISMRGISTKRDMEQSFPLWVGIIALGLLLYLFKQYRRKSEQIQLSYERTEEIDFLRVDKNHDQ